MEIIDLKDKNEGQGGEKSPSKQTYSTRNQTGEKSSSLAGQEEQEESEEEEEAKEKKEVRITERPSIFGTAPWYKRIIFSWAFPIIKKAST